MMGNMKKAVHQRDDSTPMMRAADAITIIMSHRGERWWERASEVVGRVAMDRLTTMAGATEEDGIWALREDTLTTIAVVTDGGTLSLMAPTLEAWVSHAGHDVMATAQRCKKQLAVS